MPSLAPSSGNSPKPILEITTRAASATLVLTAAFATLTFLILFFTSSHSRYQAERRRLNTLAPELTRIVYGEVLIGDERAVNTLLATLAKRHTLRSVKLQEQGKGCPQSTLLSRLIQTHPPACVTLSLADLSQPMELIIQGEAASPYDVFNATTLVLLLVPMVFFGVTFTRRMRKDLERMITHPISQLAQYPDLPLDDGEPAVEISKLSLELRRFVREREEQRNRAEVLFLRASVGDLAAQVAHDIRSPLLVLQRLIGGGQKPLAENEKNLVLGSLERIRYISDQLLQKNAGHADHHRLSCDPLLPVVVSLVAEKRVIAGAEILFEPNENAYDLFVTTVPGELSRILSNLLNNALEASPRGSSVLLEVLSEPREAKIRVTDHGRGMSSELLSKVTLPGATFGKEGGTGLGLFHAHTLCKTWGGRLEIQSQEGQGSQVTVVLPRSTPSGIFANAISLLGANEIWVVDDDPGIQAAWETRFREKGVLLPLHGFATPDSIPLERLDALSGGVVLLLDQSFGPRHGTGLQWLETHRKIIDHAKIYLVTSLAVVPSTQEKTQALGVALIYKPLLHVVPLIIE